MSTDILRGRQRGRLGFSRSLIVMITSVILATTLVNAVNHINSYHVSQVCRQGTPEACS